MNSKCPIVLSAFTLFLTLCAPSLYGDAWNQKTVVTLNGPVRIPGKVLPAGTYVFKLVDSSSNRHIVRILNEAQTEVYATILAIPDYRLEPTGKTEISFWEMPKGSTPALRAWFFPGKNYGNEFPYPRKAAQAIAAATHAPVKSVTDELGTKMAKTFRWPAAPIDKDLRTAKIFDEQAKTEPPQVGSKAFKEPASEPQESAINHAPKPAQIAKTLPATGSDLGLIGLIGMLSAGGGFLVRAVTKYVSS